MTLDLWHNLGLVLGLPHWENHELLEPRSNGAVWSWVLFPGTGDEIHRSLTHGKHVLILRVTLRAPNQTPFLSQLSAGSPTCPLLSWL